VYIKVLRISFPDNRLNSRNTSKIRGQISKRFPNYIELHHHIEKDKLLYRYPRIQYKIIKEIPIVLGIDSGVKVLRDIYDKINKIKIGKDNQVIFEKLIILKTEEFGIKDDFIRCKFLTPWLALNEENYKKYLDFNSASRSTLLEKILIGNILSMAKSLEYVVTEEIKTKVRVKPTSTSLKGVPMIGFLGTFSVNFNLPDYIGLGKSVSRGFGTIKKIRSHDVSDSR